MASTSSAQVPVQAEALPDGTTDFKPLRGKAYDMKKPHITEQPITAKNWYKHVNWLNTFFIVIVPLMGFVSTYWVKADWRTLVFSVVYYYNTGLGITAGKLNQSCFSRGM